MLGSFTDAEDHVQESLMRAWQLVATNANRMPAVGGSLAGRLHLDQPRCAAAAA